MKRTALGKGLKALIPESDLADVAKDQKKLLQLDIGQIKLSPYQPRIRMDEQKLDELAKSIQAKGVIQPIVVRPKDNGYELVAGERRLKAAKKAGLSSIPATVAEKLSKEDVLEITLIENLQREDLNPIEEAKGYRRLMEECGREEDTV